MWILQIRIVFMYFALRGEQESSPDGVTGMLHVYALIDFGGILSFFTTLIPRKSYTLPDILNEPFTVNNQGGELVVAKTVYRNCPIILTNRVTHVKLVEPDMVDFDIILGMDLLHDYFSSINCVEQELSSSIFQRNLF